MLAIRGATTWSPSVYSKRRDKKTWVSGLTHRSLCHCKLKIWTDARTLQFCLGKCFAGKKSYLKQLILGEMWEPKPHKFNVNPNKSAQVEKNCCNYLPGIFVAIESINLWTNSTMLGMCNIFNSYKHCLSVCTTILRIPFVAQDARWVPNSMFDFPVQTPRVTKKRVPLTYTRECGTQSEPQWCTRSVRFVNARCTMDSRRLCTAGSRENTNFFLMVAVPGSRTDRNV